MLARADISILYIQSIFLTINIYKLADILFFLTINIYKPGDISISRTKNIYKPGDISIFLTINTIVCWWDPRKKPCRRAAVLVVGAGFIGVEWVTELQTLGRKDPKGIPGTGTLGNSPGKPCRKWTNVPENYHIFIIYIIIYKYLICPSYYSHHTSYICIYIIYIYWLVWNMTGLWFS